MKGLDGLALNHRVSKMKIIFDLTALDEKPTGIARVAESVAKKYIIKFPHNEYVLIFNKKIPERFPIKKSTDNIEIVVLNARKKILRLFALPNYIRKSDADYILCCAFPGPLVLRDKRIISIVHDLNPWKFPKTMKTEAMLTWRLLIKHALKTNRAVLNDSNTVKGEIEEQFGYGRLIPIHLGVDIVENSDDDILKKNGLIKESYILSVSTLEPRKNLKVLLTAFAKMANPDDVKLVLTGGSGWKLEDAIGSLSNYVKDKVIFTGYVSDQELKSLYTNARFFVSTSIYEGFGLPMIEAVKNNLPIVVSDIAVYNEITDGKAIFFKSNDENSLISVLEKSISDYNLRQTKEFKDLKELAQEYNWDRYVEILNNVLVDLRKENE